jgi:septal ring factor EnvC (AmiA/AmiB activator)
MLYRAIPITFCFTLVCASPVLATDTQDSDVARVSTVAGSSQAKDTDVGLLIEQMQASTKDYTIREQRQIIAERDAEVASLHLENDKLEAQLYVLTAKRTQELEFAKTEASSLAATVSRLEAELFSLTQKRTEESATAQAKIGSDQLMEIKALKGHLLGFYEK